MNEPSTPTLWALLVGVDCCMGQTISGLPRYGNLRGCVNDTALMDEFLRIRLNVPAGRWSWRWITTRPTASGTAPWPTGCGIPCEAPASTGRWRISR
jgi:hypothetical protein